jgi:uncharacterized protein YacL
VGDALPAAFAALGAVIGLIVGAILGRIVGFAVSDSELSDLIAVAVGGLAGAFVLAWLGLRLAGRFANRDAKPSS